MKTKATKSPEQPTALRRHVLDGLQRLAFESAAPKLFIEQDENGAPCISATALDPYHITEIKQVKGGGLEIKFYDRISAMEKLYELLAQEGSSIYSALENAAQVWQGSDDSES